METGKEKNCIVTSSATNENGPDATSIFKARLTNI
jgi:hypothetical protein